MIRCHQWQLDSNLWPWDDDVSALPLYYHCWLFVLQFFLIIFSLSMLAVVAGLKPLVLGWWGASSGSWTQTFGIGIMRWVFYHCLLFLLQLFPGFFSLLMPPALAGLKPMTLGWWGECSTTMQSVVYPSILSYHFLSTNEGSSGWTQTLDLGMMRCQQ